MNEELQNKALEILTQIQSGVQAAGNLAASELPDIARQYIIYGLVKNWFITITSLVCIAIFTIMLIKKFRQPWSEPWSEPWLEPYGITSAGLCGLSYLVILLVSSSIFCSNISSTLLVTFAPKVWLIQELAGIVR